MIVLVRDLSRNAFSGHLVCDWLGARANIPDLVFDLALHKSVQTAIESISSAQVMMVFRPRAKQKQLDEAGWGLLSLEWA